MFHGNSFPPFIGVVVNTCADTLMIPDLSIYDRFVVLFSGGKDSIAAFLQLLECGVNVSKVELWHHEVDGRESSFMDWEVTSSYCTAFARAFGVPIFFSWKEGGFKGELLRNNEFTKATVFEDEHGKLVRVGGGGGKRATRRKFPQLSADLRTRWCSAYLKVDVGSSALVNQERFAHSKTLIVSGERAEESPARSLYKSFEVDRSDNRYKGSRTVTSKHVSARGKSYEVSRIVVKGADDRYIDHWRAVHHFTEHQVWDSLRRHRVRPHPAYYLRYSRVSCKFCIFLDKDGYATSNKISPVQGAEIMSLEEEFGVTIKRKTPLKDLIASGTPYPEADLFPEMVELATSRDYTVPVLVGPDEQWVLPAGAFRGGCCGPV
jgi:3'-phosphoadenosine 5'-phosphosulfate sulfotransferase (PAPS reductase)/FAD synthetase